MIRQEKYFEFRDSKMGRSCPNPLTHKTLFWYILEYCYIFRGSVPDIKARFKYRAGRSHVLLNDDKVQCYVTSV